MESLRVSTPTMRGNLGKAAAAELLLILHAERAVVRRDNLQVVVAQPAPEVAVVVARTQRAVCTRAWRPGASSSGVPRSASSSRDGYCGQVSACTSQPRSRASVARSRARCADEMHQIDRHLRHLGQGDCALGARRLCDLGAGQGVMNRRGVAVGQGALDRVDGQAGSGMHADGAQLAGAASRGKSAGRRAAAHQGA